MDSVSFSTPGRGTSVSLTVCGLENKRPSYYIHTPYSATAPIDQTHTLNQPQKAPITSYSITLGSSTGRKNEEI